MEETNNTERGPISDKAINRKPDHIVLGMPKSAAVSEGRTPVVIHGDNNTINIIERQYSDRTASETVKAMLDADRAQGEMVKDFIGNIIDLGAMFMPKMQATPRTKAPKEPEVVKPNAPVKSVAKRTPAKKAAVKKVPAKKAAKKAPAKKSTSKRK